MINSSFTKLTFLDHNNYRKMILTHVFLCLSFFQSVFGIGTEFTVGNLGNIKGSLQYTEWSNRTVYSFRGIPFAEPPIGDLRFRRPVPITSWNGTLDATSYGPACPQSSMEYSEDCLTLNVFVPEIEICETDSLLPVLIFIHGGFYRTDTARAYVPLRLMDTDDLIVVVPQFRLGLLGLFSLLTDDVPGNVQFLDQVMAMQWVQDNIQYFGGDKNRVTLYGQSSGAASVHLHLLSPLTNGLFHRTILQSGSALRLYGIDREPEESAVIVSDYCGCKNMTDAVEIAACMRSLSVDDIITCATNYLDNTIYDGLTRARCQMPVIETTGGDQRFLIADPQKLLESGEFLKLPMMGGATKNDGSSQIADIYNSVLVPRGLTEDPDYLRYNLIEYTLRYLGVPDFTYAIMHTMRRVYFTDNQLGDFLAMAPGLIDIATIISYKSGIYETLRANRNFEDTYIYTFNYRVFNPNLNLLYPFDLGAYHTSDLGLLMPKRDYQYVNDVDMAKLLIKLWTSFVINGVPAADGVTWPAMSTPVGPYIVLDSNITVKENFLDEFVTV